MNYLDAMNYGSKILKSNNIKNFILDSEILLESNEFIKRGNFDKFRKKNKQKILIVTKIKY